MSVAAILLAAGRGERMRAGQNKVFLPLLGHPLLSYSLRIFALLDDVTEVICVAHYGEKQRIEDCIIHSGLEKKVKIVYGGETRQASVKAGLNALDSRHEFVLIHDGARPLLTVLLVNQLLNRVKEVGAVIPAVPVKDTIKRVVSAEVCQTLKRRELWAVQTPQVFRYELIKKAHQSDVLATDDAALVEAFHPVHIIEGDYSNIKITTSEDLWMAEVLLERGRGQDDAHWTRL